MCARYSITKEEIRILIGEIEIIIAIGARYNIAPTQLVPIIFPRKGGGFQATEMTWGWQPQFTSQLLINAQAESIESKPTFKNVLHQRCLLPADGFYEWTGERAERRPVRFTKPDDALFCMAGLWRETTTQPEDVPVTTRSLVVLTTTPNKTVGKIHNRMPFIVKPEHYRWWLDEGELFRTVLNFPDRDELNHCPVQPALNNVRSEGPELIRPYVKAQQDLF
ncbi:MAG: SOS response-associated peptidase [Verrucomicrobiae bacterium]|nr:SOS response-associated peptidase [Verrucomicrobiae bacterium]